MGRATTRPAIVALSRLALRVRRGRTTAQVLEIAGSGARQLGLRLAAFQVVDEDVILRYFATASRRLRAIEALIGRPLAGLRAPLARLDLAQHVLGGRHVYRGDHDLFDRVLLHATGHDLAPLEASSSTAGIANGVVAPLFVGNRPWGLLAVASHDLCEEDAAAVALFATQVGAALEGAECVDELVRREQLAVLGELAAVVAHEVRNPLGTIFNAVALLRRILRTSIAQGPVPGEGERLLSIVFEEAERLDHIVTDLLEFARPPTLRLESASLGVIAEDVLCAARRRPEAERVAFHLDVPADLRLVDLDVRFVQQALLNLVVNGMQAMLDGGALTVRIRTAGGTGSANPSVLIQVIDTGPGIPADARDRVFEPFFTTKASGTGLGLALVKRAVELHGGSVDFESGAGGTTFALRLPLLVPTRPASRRSVGGAIERRLAPARL